MYKKLPPKLFRLNYIICAFHRKAVISICLETGKICYLLVNGRNKNDSIVQFLLGRTNVVIVR